MGPLLHAYESFSCEIVPSKLPYTETTARRTAETIVRLAAQKPAMFSVTFGAGGTSDKNTIPQSLRVAIALAKTFEFPVAAHVTCKGADKEGVESFVRLLLKNGINRFVALAGDPQPLDSAKEYHKYASQLIEAIEILGLEAVRSKCVSNFKISAAADFSPYTINPTEVVLDNIAENISLKLEAGADELITQYSFEQQTIITGIAGVRKRGILHPIRIGLSPFTNFAKAFEMAGEHHVPVSNETRTAFKDADKTPVFARATSVAFSNKQVVDFLISGETSFHVYAANMVERSAQGHGMVTGLISHNDNKRPADESQIDRLTAALLENPGIAA